MRFLFCDQSPGFFFGKSCSTPTHSVTSDYTFLFPSKLVEGFGCPFFCWVLHLPTLDTPISLNADEIIPISCHCIPTFQGNSQSASTRQVSFHSLHLITLKYQNHVSCSILQQRHLITQFPHVVPVSRQINFASRIDKTKQVERRFVIHECKQIQSLLMLKHHATTV